MQEVVRQLGHLHHLDVLDGQGALDGFAAQVRIGGGAGHGDVHVAGVADVDAAHLFGEVVGDAVLEGQLLVDAERHFVQLADLAIAVADEQIDDQQIAELNVSLGLGYDLAIGRQKPAFLLDHFFLAEGMDGAAQLQTLVIWQIEMRPNLDLELVDERSLARQLDVGRIDVGGAQGGDVVVLGELLQAGQQDLALDLIADFLLKAALDDPARRLTGPETGHVGVADQFAEFLAEARVDVLAFDGDLDVLLARPDIADLDVLMELGRLVRGGGGRLLRMLVFVRSRGRVIRLLFVSHGFLLSSAAATGHRYGEAGHHAGASSPPPPRNNFRNSCEPERGSAGTPPIRD